MILKLTERAYLRGVSDDLGYCLACGAEKGCCEPDAREYPCDDCGEFKVYGLEELMMMGKVEIK